MDPGLTLYLMDLISMFTCVVKMLHNVILLRHQLKVMEILPSTPLLSHVKDEMHPIASGTNIQ